MKQIKNLLVLDWFGFVIPIFKKVSFYFIFYFQSICFYYSLCQIYRLPSWLLRHKDLKIRTSDTKYLFYVERYFKKLLSLVEPLQFTKGGPIIAVQIENEYGNVKEEGKPIDTGYLEALRDILRKNGIVELLFTSDTPSAGFYGEFPVS